MDPQPVYVWRSTPASPKAGGINVAAVLPSGRKPFPSRKSSASNLPGPHAPSTRLTVGTLVCSRLATGCRFGDSDTIAPTFRSRLAQPSSRFPMPGAKESSTVEWHSAHSIPTDFSEPAESKNPLTPTTELSFSNARVTFGSLRSTCPAARASLMLVGRASTSTFRPTARAVFGLTPGPTPPLALPAIAWFRCRVPPQKSWSPNVSNRNVCRPSLTRSSAWSSSGSDSLWIDVEVELAALEVPAVAWNPTARTPPSAMMPSVATVLRRGRRRGCCSASSAAPGGGSLSCGFAIAMPRFCNRHGSMSYRREWCHRPPLSRAQIGLGSVLDQMAVDQESGGQEGRVEGEQNAEPAGHAFSAPLGERRGRSYRTDDHRAHQRQHEDRQRRLSSPGHGEQPEQAAKRAQADDSEHRRERKQDRRPAQGKSEQQAHHQPGREHQHQHLSRGGECLAEVDRALVHRREQQAVKSARIRLALVGAVEQVHRGEQSG